MIKYLKPEEIKEEWHGYFDFGAQEVRKRDLHIRATCPQCGSIRWVKVFPVRRGQSPYCHKHCHILFADTLHKPLQPDEVAPEWRGCFSYDQQEMRPGPQHSMLHIQMTCPDCGLCRWIPSSRARGRLTPLCRPCSRKRQSGPDHPLWTGGVAHSRGYCLLHIDTLPEHDRQLARATLPLGLYIQEHRLVMAQHLGRPLTKDEIVHHRNGIKDDNRPDNLRLLTRKTHGNAWGDPYYQKWQEALSEIERLKVQLKEAL